MKFLIQSLLSIALLTILTACDFDVPAKEMSLAKTKITESYKVKANKFSKDNLEKATSHLLNSHSELEKEDVDKAKAEALKSIEFSKKAIEISLPKLAEESLKNAKELFLEIDLLNAKENNPIEFEKVEKLIKKAETLTKDKKFWNSHIDSQNSIQISKSLKAEALAKIPDLIEQIDELNKKYIEYTTNENAGMIENQLVTLKQIIDLAENKLELKDLKKTITLLATSKALTKNIDKNLMLAELEKNINKAKNRLDKITLQIDELKSGKRAETLKKELTALELLRESASESIKNKNYEEANTTIGEMESSISNINQTYATKQLEEAEKNLATIIEKDKKKLHEKEIETATKSINESKVLLTNKDYLNSSKKSDEAIVTLSKIEFIKIDTEKVEKPKKVNTIYIVKYRKNNTDCLWRIAQSQYKNAKLWPLIYVANKKIIKNPDLIFPGQRFIIPPKPEKISSKKKSEVKKKIVLKKEK